MALEMVYYPDPRLSKPSAPITKATAELKGLIPEMFEVMYRHRGIGLAGPQVGIMQRIIVANLTGDPKNRKSEQVFINPEIVAKGEASSVYEEGCLSIPDYYAEVERPATVRVSYLDRHGSQREVDADGLLATCLQHEIDHLDGVLFIDHISRLKRDMVVKKFKKLAKDRQPTKRMAG